METQNSGNYTDRDPRADGARNTKKVRFKEAVDGEATNMVVDSDQRPIMSFKDKLLGGGVASSDGDLEGIFGKNESDFELLEGDVNMSMVDGFRQSPSRIALRTSWSMDHIWAIPYCATMDEKFNPTQPYPSVVMASIRLPDLQTDNRTRGRFARLAVFINLDKPLVSQVLVDGAVQRVKYEALPTVCFCCGKYGHVKELCPLVVANLASGSSVDAAVASSGDDVRGGGKGKRVDYGPWMLVERSSRVANGILGLMG
ncbi:hypothetical protein Gohar_028444 [Gossypium harknessii]|uniref:CCHC-type domain-containing protein n=1 Tax=Gossypium harknessii TaxID=34285 RepID=A0A7J9ICA8_9ROSI|nr:hypothetical protein [Gossypium harknessii]